MSISKDFLEDNFFIIDSNNLDDIAQRFYGYVIDDDGVVKTEMVSSDKLTPNGAYLFIDVMEDKIEIIQDFIGSYGLYLYQIDNYFAISNSFIKLVDYLKSSHNLSLNRDYANDLLFTNL